MHNESADRTHTGWLLHGLHTPGQATIEHAELACDEEFTSFLMARLDDEIHAAIRRHRQDEGRQDEDRRNRYEGLRLLRLLVLDLTQGRLPDDVTLDLLVSAYGTHPDFRLRWSTPATMLPTPVRSRS